MNEIISANNKMLEQQKAGWEAIALRNKLLITKQSTWYCTTTNLDWWCSSVVNKESWIEGCTNQSCSWSKCRRWEKILFRDKSSSTKSSWSSSSSWSSLPFTTSFSALKQFKHLVIQTSQHKYRSFWEVLLQQHLHQQRQCLMYLILQTLLTLLEQCTWGLRWHLGLVITGVWRSMGGKCSSSRLPCRFSATSWSDCMLDWWWIYGHVAVVTAVQSTTSIQVSEANYLGQQSIG